MVDKEKLDSIFKNISSELPVGILIHPSPDPDCLGAAAGFTIFLQHAYGISSKIYHLGEISHPQNKSLKNVLHINLEEGKSFDHTKVSATVLLDTDLTNSGFKNEKFIKSTVRIDHHDTDRDEESELEDVRQTGSTCAIIWEYLKEFDIPMEEYPDVATALVLGIKTDTVDFTSNATTELDMQAFRLLLPFVAKDKLAKVTQFPLPKIVFEAETRAYKNKETRNATLTAFAGELTQLNRDVIPTIADRFARMDGINTAVILGIIGNNIVASVRSSDQRVDVADFCVKVFGKAHAGGREGAGGASVPLGLAFEILSGKEVRDVIIKEIISAFSLKIFTTLGEYEAS